MNFILSTPENGSKPAADKAGRGNDFVQTKLNVGSPNDRYEVEADAVADQVMRMPEPAVVQRKCSLCEEKEKLQRKPEFPFIQKKESQGGVPVSDQIGQNIAAAKGNGDPLPVGTRSFMESRFGNDFSNVRIHAGENAVQMSRELHAQAFTVGSDVFFNQNKFSPESDSGKRLLAHELTHTVQQTGVQKKTENSQNISSSEPQISRFSDDTHHIIDEAGLFGGGFREDEIKEIETGNKLRDYSQLPKFGNAVLLCRYNKFGGYSADEHFDNYIWDRSKNQWVDRELTARQKAGVAPDNVRGSDPISYIKAEFSAYINFPVGSNLPHLGKAFHAVEDFFAHSNFVELISGDTRFGSELVSGSVPGTMANSLAHTVADVSSPDSAEYFRGVAEDAKKGTGPLSHANIAKDHPADRNHKQARRLAALVVQELGKDIHQVLERPADERPAALESTVFAKIDKYLKLPDLVNDRWWETLTEADNGFIDRLLEKAEKNTPVTVNQCAFSPLRNLEASKDSTMKIFAGAAFPINVFGARGFAQVGGGLFTPLNLDDATMSTRADKPEPFVGGQITLTLP
jgi:hypothetical protein